MQCNDCHDEGNPWYDTPVEIRPCPFCGGKSTVMYSQDIRRDLTLGEDDTTEGVFWVKCTQCQVSQWYHDCVIKAKRAWNMRISD